MKLFLYRTLTDDDEGDPIDHGVVRAMNIDQAASLIIDHIKKLATTIDPQTVRIYPLHDRNTAGILEEAGHFQDFGV